MAKPPPLPPRLASDEDDEARPLPAIKPPLKSLSHIKRVEIFGKFKWKYTPTPTARERIAVDPGWQRENIVLLDLPLMHLNAGKPIRARFHRLAAPRVDALFTAWQQAGLLLHVQSWDGSYVARFKRGKGGGSELDLSNHSWGTAFDINARWNRLNIRPAPIGATGSVMALVSIANELGFAWGGHFASRPDGMHFECVRVA